MLLTKNVSTIDEGREKIRQTFEDGSALKKFHQMIVGQGVSQAIADQLVSDDEEMVRSILKLSEHQHVAAASSQGFVQSIDSFKLGTIVQRLGKTKTPKRFFDLCRFFRRRPIEIDRSNRFHRWSSSVETRRRSGRSERTVGDSLRARRRRQTLSEVFGRFSFVFTNQCDRCSAAATNFQSFNVKKNKKRTFFLCQANVPEERRDG